MAWNSGGVIEAESSRPASMSSRVAPIISRKASFASVMMPFGAGHHAEQVRFQQAVQPGIAFPREILGALALGHILDDYPDGTTFPSRAFAG